MKKVILILLAAMLAMALLVSCGSMKDGSPTSSSNGMSGGAGSAPAPSAAPMAPPAPMPEMAEEIWYDSDYMEYGYDDAEVAYTSAVKGEPGGAGVPENAAAASMAEKIIYSMYADIETVDFDDTMAKVEQLVIANGGFKESSYTGGRNYAQSYYGLQTHRTANYVLRIPANRLKAVEESLGSLGNVTSTSTNAENITSQFYDTQSRLNSYKIQEERLLDMLRKADNVPDMISIEQRLADVRYSIESLTTTLNNWQSKVDYSTLTLNIYEVAELTEISPVQQRTYWQQVGDGLQSTTFGVGRFFTDLFKGLIINLPVLIVLAVIVVVIIIIVRKRVRRRREEERVYYQKRSRHTAKYENPYANQNAYHGANQNANQNVNNQNVNQGANQSESQGVDNEANNVK